MAIIFELPTTFPLLGDVAETRTLIEEININLTAGFPLKN